MPTRHLKLARAFLSTVPRRALLRSVTLFGAWLGLASVALGATAECYSKFPDWDRAVDARQHLSSKANSLSANTRNELLERFSALQQRDDSYRSGTAPICGDLARLNAALKEHEHDVETFNAQLAVHEANAAQHRAQCSVVTTVDEERRCNSWAAQINGRKAELDAWAAKITARAAELDNRSAAFNKAADKINSEWTALLQSFVADANAAMTALPETAAAFENALNKAASEVNPNRAPPTSADARHRHCSEFFRALGRQLNASDQGWPTGDDDDANEIYRRLVTDKTGSWRELVGKSDIELQRLANEGGIIIGVVTHRPSGHVAVVAPVPPGLDLEKFGSWGPMIRDGNVYVSRTGTISPKDWGTVRASKAFTDTDKPRWILWTKSQSH